MSNDIINNRSPRNNRALAGLFLVVLGGIYLFRQMDLFFIPEWLFSWPVILIVIGILMGVKHNFRNPTSYVLMFIGSVFLIAHTFHIQFLFFWPLILISIGIRLILRRDDQWCRSRWERHVDWRHNDQPTL
jgi:predicted membrane protein